MQPKPLPPPPVQPALPLEIPPQAGPRPEMEEVVLGHCAPEEAWETLKPAGRDQLRKAWLGVLKEIVGDAQEDR
jgi:hypothetical protein